MGRGRGYHNLKVRDTSTTSSAPVCQTCSEYSEDHPKAEADWKETDGTTVTVKRTDADPPGEDFTSSYCASHWEQEAHAAFAATICTLDRTDQELPVTRDCFRDPASAVSSRFTAAGSHKVTANALFDEWRRAPDNYGRANINHPCADESKRSEAKAKRCHAEMVSQLWDALARITYTKGAGREKEIGTVRGLVVTPAEMVRES